MKKTLLLIFLALPPLAGAATSGVDAQGLKEDLRASGAKVEGRLRAAEAQYRLLISSEAMDAQAYLNYRDGLAETGEEVKKISEHVRGYAEFVQRLEDSEPKPDDMNELRALRVYAEGLDQAAEAAYSAALRKLDQAAAKLEQAGAVLVPSDPAALEQEKQRRLLAAQKARAMGDKAREFEAIRSLSGLDPAQGGQLMGKFFDGLSPAERGAYSEQLKTPAVKKGASAALLDPAGRAPRPLYRPMGAAVPAIGGEAAGLNSVPAAGDTRPQGKPLISGNDFKTSLWSAVGRVSPATAAPHLREASLSSAADAKADWLGRKKQDFLALAARSKDAEERAGYERTAANIDALLARRDAVPAAGGVDQRSAALGEWNTSVSRLMDGSAEGKAERALVDKRAALEAEYGALKTDAERARWLKERGAEFDETGARLGEFYKSNPEYLKARKTEADSQNFLRSSMPNFRDGTEFSAGELGLKLPPGQKVSVSSLKDGPRGISYKDADGLEHFQSFDDTVRINEIAGENGEKHKLELRLAADGTVNTAERGADGRLLRTEEKKPDGSVAVEIYGADGKPAASRLRRPDGSTVDAVVMGKEGVKRVVYTDPKGAATFEITSLAGKDGYPKQSGRIVDGQLVLDRLDADADNFKVRAGANVFEVKSGGKSAGFEVDAEAIKRLPQDQRGAAAAEAAAVLAGGNAAQAGPLKQFISQVARQGGPGARTTIVSSRDDKGNAVYVANILSADGSQKQVLGQWDKLSAAEAAGLPSDVGLNVSVRSGAKGEDMGQRQFLKLFRFNGENVTDRYSAESRTTGNWFVGYGAEADNYVHRVNSATQAPIRSIKTGTETLYTSPSILGHTGNAIGTLGKGAVQLTGSAIAVVGAGTVGWADKDLQSEFLERAKSNFYGNDVSRQLGKDYIGGYYEEGYAGLRVSEERNIQNVGREMASMGKPTLGAVLQGGVNFSNGVATTLLTAPLGGPMTGAIGKTGTIGTTVASVGGKGYGAYKAVKGVYDTGASGVEFVQAYRAFDENDPASKERYYAAVTDLTSKGLNAPKTVSGVFKLAETGKEVKGALTGKGGPSPILGPDGKPYVKPPEELSDFRKFMLGKNEPGLLTKVMTKDISGGLDPRLSVNLANNPVSNAVNSAERWASAKVDKWLGRPEELPRPGLIVPGQAAPNPDAKIIVPGQAVPNPDAKIVVPGQTVPRPDVKLIVPGQAVPRPDVKLIVPGQAEPNPDAKIYTGD